MHPKWGLRGPEARVDLHRVGSCIEESMNYCPRLAVHLSLKTASSTLHFLIRHFSNVQSLQSSRSIPARSALPLASTSQQQSRNILTTTSKMEGTNLPSINRFITAHNAEGQAVFSNAIPEPLGWNKLPNGAGFALGYTTSQYPVDLNQDKDVSTYQSYLSTPPGLVIPGGTVLRFVDCPPNSLSPMHRTVSLDYGVVLEGEVELVLDSGETRAMKRGDVAVQRGTNHAWRNPSGTQWARMMYVLQESKPIVLGERALGEDYGVGMDGVPASGGKK